MKPKKLIWQIYPAIIIVMVVVLVSVTLYGTRVFRGYYLDEAESDLEARINLVKERIGRLLVEDDFEQLRNFCRDVGRASETRITIVARNGRVVADSNENPDNMENHDHRPEIISGFQGEKGTSIRFSTTLKETMLYHALPIRLQTKSTQSEQAGSSIPYVIRMAIPITSLDHVLNRMYWRVVLGSLMIAGFAAFLTYLVARSISSPIEEMTRTAERFAKGDFSERMQPQLKNSSSMEIAELALAMDNMAELLDEKIKAIVTHRNQLETVFSSMVESIIALDLQERVISMNTAAARLLGVQRKAVQGKFIQEVLRNIPIQNQIQQILSNTDLIEDEIVLQDEQGEKYLQTSVVSLRDGKGDRVGVLIVMNDVTNLRKLERVRRDFVANVSHELRTPITSIRGYVETLLDGALDNRDDCVRFLKIVMRQSGRLNAIIDDLLVLSRIEQEEKEGNISLSSQKLLPVLKSAVQTCQLQADQHTVNLVLDCPEHLILPINGTLIEQAVVNLLINAITYSKHADTVKIVATTAENEEDMVCIQVLDQGCGIAREHLPRLFERFYRSDKARSREAGGTGLGLAIVKHIIQAHRGHVEVESREGAGSTFSLYLPAAL